MSGRGRICDPAWRWISTALVVVVVVGPMLLPGWARADGGVDGAQAIAFLNQQRAANGIPPITTTNENYAAAWCPDEDHGPPGGETWRDWSPFVDWTADSSPWTNAPLHQISMYDPRMDTAGDVNVDGDACMGLGGDANQPASGVTFYSFVWEGGHSDVPPSETVPGEGPFAPQQLVGIPDGQATGPQPLLFPEGMGSAPHAISWSLTDASGMPVPNVKFADSTTAAAAGYSPFFLSQGGVMIPPVLAVDTTYNGTVVWEQSGGGGTATQTFSFTTGTMSNTVTIAAYLELSTVNIDVTTPAPNPTVQIAGPQNLTLTPNADGWVQATLSPGTWTACAESGGSGTIYQAGSDCTTFTISAIPTAPSGSNWPTGSTGSTGSTGTAGTTGSGGVNSASRQPPHLTVRLTRTGRRVVVTVTLARHAAGTLRLSARDGKRNARVVPRGGRYTFTASGRGRWTVAVSFTGRAGWQSQKIVRTIFVP